MTFFTFYSQNLNGQCAQGKATIEVGVFVDYAAYNHYNGNKDQILNDIAIMFSNIENFYDDKLAEINFDLDFVIAGGGPVIWETPDQFGVKVNPLKQQLNSYWNIHMPCVQKDAIILLTGKDSPGRAGGATPSICNDPPNAVGIAFTDKFGIVHLDRSAFILAHEIGHLMGSPELEQTICGSDCVGTGLNLLMCSDGGTTGGLQTAILGSCTLFDAFQPFLLKYCDDCLNEPADIPECQICKETGMIVADNLEPVGGCIGKDTINYTITVCNSCDAQTLTVQTTYDINKVDLLEYAPYSHNFDTLISLGSSIRYLTSVLNLEGQECMDFHFSVVVKSGQSSNIVSR